MCKWGTSTPLTVTIPAHLSHTGVERQDVKDVDSCIAPIVRALNDAGVTTVASCCGHGERPGNIALSDGREIVIAPDYETSRRIDSLFPPINETVKSEAIESLAITLAEAICADENTKRQNYIRDLLIEFAEEIKRQAIEP